MRGSGLYWVYPPCISPVSQDQPINLVNALIAVAFGVIYAGLAPVLAGGDVRPNLMLAMVVAVTALFGIGAGAVWAFFGGLAANLLTTDPMGSVPLGLLLAAGLVALSERVLGPPRAVSVLVAGAIGSVLVDLVSIVTLTLVGGDSASIALTSIPGLVVLTAIVNGVLAVIAWALIRAGAGRLGRLPEPA